MNGLQVREVNQPPKIKAGYLFNTAEFQSLKSGEKKYFALFEKEQPIARICFSVENDQAISGYQATFGSVDSEYHLPGRTVKFFLEQVCTALESNGIKDIFIKHWPDCYALPDSWQAIFDELGFSVVNSEIDQYLVVNEQDYYQVVNKNQHSNLNQAREKGYKFACLNINELPIVYDLIQKTLARKGYPLSMTYDDLYRTISLLPDKYLLFGVFDGKKLIAASISVRISKQILYNFYHADDFIYRSSSPMVMLIKEIYQYCQQNDIRLLDLGISTETGMINQGLFNFKKNLGCSTAKKNTYRWRYE
jgi:hypothetical protein